MDKFNGAIAGHHLVGECGLPAVDATEHATLGELLSGPDGTLLASVMRTLDGSVDWRSISGDADVAAAVNRIIAQSQMASMLRDGGRNRAWASAITQTVASMPHARVLDIGAGTGLLSLIAQRAGAESVVACEQWAPMARIATEVIAANGAGDCVTVHTRHSTDVPAPHPQCNAVISEILDSALLGEGVVPALADAYARLTVAGPLACVPVRARLIAQLVSCPAVRSWHSCATATLAVPGRADALRVPLDRRDWGDVCGARSRAIPVHSERLRRCGMEPVSAPFVAAKLDFTRQGIEGWDAAHAVPHVHVVSPLRTAEQASGHSADALLVWWEAVLWEPPNVNSDGGSTPDAVCYSTEPQVGAAVHGWQDHWVQTIVPFNSPVAPRARRRDAVSESAAAAAAWGVTTVSRESSAPSDSLASIVPRPEDSTPVFTVAAVVGRMAIDWLIEGGEATVWPSRRSRALSLRKAAEAALQDAITTVATAPAGVAHASSAGVKEFPAPLLFAEPQPCTCGMHTEVMSAERRAALADPAWAGVFGRSVHAVITAVLACTVLTSPSEPLRVLCLGDGGLCALSAVAASGSPELSGSNFIILAMESTYEGANHVDTIAHAAIDAMGPLRSDGGEGVAVHVAVVVPGVTFMEALVSALQDVYVNDDSCKSTQNGGESDDDNTCVNVDDVGMTAQDTEVPVNNEAAPADKRAHLLRCDDGCQHDDNLKQSAHIVVASDHARAISGELVKVAEDSLSQNVDFIAASPVNVDPLAPMSKRLRPCDRESHAMSSDSPQPLEYHSSGTDVEQGAVPLVRRDEGESGADSRASHTLHVFDVLAMEPHCRGIGPSPLAGMVHMLLRAVASAPMLRAGARVVPSKATVQAQAVLLHELYDSHGPVGSVCGFSHAAFDEVEARWWAEPSYCYPMWQYRHAIVGPTVDVAHLDYNTCVQTTQQSHAGDANSFLPRTRVQLFPGCSSASIDAESLTFNAVMIWVTYDLSDGESVTTGLTPGWNERPAETSRGAVGSAALLPSSRQCIKFVGAPARVTAHVMLDVDLAGFVERGEPTIEIIT